MDGRETLIPLHPGVLKVGNGGEGRRRMAEEAESEEKMKEERERGEKGRSRLEEREGGGRGKRTSYLFQCSISQRLLLSSLKVQLSSLVPRPSPATVFDRLQ